ncbi:MAG: MFS transporter [Alphaproteobacteria bacterium]|jgi:MHS family proline/betaine transporter-like MFS transporter
MRKVPENQAGFLKLKTIQKKTNILFFVPIGNFLELYDYTLYAVLLYIISPEFFPSNSSSTSLLFGMLSFALTMLICPLSAWFWGWYGDRYGRLPMLKQSIMLMAIPSLLISLLPNYKEIGILAPILLISCRILQAISASGEVMGGKIFAMEHLGKRNFGNVSGLTSLGGSLGVGLAMGMGLLISKTGISWRLPFFIGGSLAIVGLMIRRKLSESPEFISLLKNMPKNNNKEAGIISIVKQYKTEVIITITLGSLLGMLSYTISGFLSPYLISLGFSKETAYSMGLAGLFTCAITSFLTGRLIDKIGDARKIMNVNILSCIFIFPLSFSLILLSAHGYNIIMLYMAYILLGGVLGINATCCSVIMYKLFTPENRCRGVMICYALGIAIFGGFSPLILQLLNGINHMLPAGALTIATIIMYYIYIKNMEKKHDALS